MPRLLRWSKVEIHAFCFSLFLTVPVCPTQSISNGYVTYQGSLFNGGYTVNSVVNFHCNDGFSRYGTQSRTCQSSQNWSGQKPECKRKNLFKHMQQITNRKDLPLGVYMLIFLYFVGTCSVLPSPPNGYVSYSRAKVGRKVPSEHW